MTIAVNVQLPVAGEEAKIGLTIPVSDVIPIINDIAKLPEGSFAALVSLKELLTSNINL